MTARFDSRCPACGGRIAAGSTIRKDAVSGKYVCAACVRQADEDDAEARWENSEYARGVNDTAQAQLMGPAGSEAREAAYMAMEAQWAREGFDG
jgi:DNA-directed RNA polymerase subunit RPC12/RpoP